MPENPISDPMIEQVARVENGKEHPDVSMFRADPETEKTVTPRQLEILSYSGLGLTREQIAVKSGISVNTVKCLQNTARRRLGDVQSTIEALAVAINRGLLDPASLLPLEHDSSRLGELSEVENKALVQIVQGMTNPGIATTLETTPRMAESVVASTMKKIGAKSRTQAGVFYLAANAEARQLPIDSLESA